MVWFLIGALAAGQRSYYSSADILALPARTRWNQWFSICAKWRTKPARLRALGGTDRRASWSGSSPSHFISIVSR